MTPRVSLVVVSFRSAAECADAVESFRAEAARAGAAAEVVIVDHSESAEEETRLRRIAPDRLLVRANRGYAAGVNAGVAASSAPTLLVGNPDIGFRPGSVAALLRALDSGWAVVGPQFALAGFLFPPADVQTPLEEVRRWRASRSRAAWARHFRRELARWRRVWDAAGPVSVPTLSGALLAMRRDVFERVGLWDEAYFLYFEETDWLRRLGAAGLRAAVVPGAVVAHRWARAADPAEFAGVFEASRRRYLSRNFGVRGRLAAALPRGAEGVELPPLPAPAPTVAAGDVLWLLSPSPLGFPAAGLRCGGPPPADSVSEFLAQHGRPQRLSLRAVDPGTGRILGAWRCEPEGR
ncbi:MAG TPA: glycosyltransferase [Thermoanaerobaculaceae bacterium]|nr:glycosyltransferase [Thermoanaerobaculaceae bacterium]